MLAWSRPPSLTSHPHSLLALAALAVVYSPDLALAGGFTGPNMPWDGPLTRLLRFFSGPVAFTLSLLVILVVAVAIVLGGEISDFLRRALYAVGGLAVLAMFANLASALAAP